MAAAVHQLQIPGTLSEYEHNPSSSPLSWKQLCHFLPTQAQHDAGINFMALPRFRNTDSAPYEIPDETSSLVALLRACTKAKDLHRGTTLHNDILKRGLLEKCSNALITMYAKCGALAEAKELLDMHPCRDVFAWTAVIAGYAQAGHGQDAITCFERMQCQGLSPDAATFSCVLKACGSIRNVEIGEQIHDEIAKQGLLGKNVVLSTALVDMYVKCGAISKAHLLLEELPSRTVVTWNALIGGYAQQGEGEQALNCFERMQGEGLYPNVVTFACALKACGILGATHKGEQIHDEIARQVLLKDNIALGNALVDMYAKCGALVKAERVLQELPSRNVVSWSALITGYAQQGQGEQALNCFDHMHCEGIPPNEVTFASILKACGSLGSLEKGTQIHDQISRQGLLQDNVVLGNALVDMYAKCGALAKAQQMLEELPFRDVVSWNTLITGYAQQGQAEQALNCFKRMQHEGMSPDIATFSCVLNVCNHLGLVEDADMYFATMSSRYGVKPNVEIYTCMIDLFGRAGHLEKAVRIIQEMSSSDYSAVWHALLGACWKWGDVNIGRWAFEQAVHIDKRDGSSYVLMANIYAAAGMHAKAKEVEALRMENKAWEKPGHSLWIDKSGDVNTFSVWDIKHLESKSVCTTSEESKAVCITSEGMVHKLTQKQGHLQWVTPKFYDAYDLSSF